MVDLLVYTATVVLDTAWVDKFYVPSILTRTLLLIRSPHKVGISPKLYRIFHWFLIRFELVSNSLL